MTENPCTFLDLPNAALDDADVAVVCMPYEGTVSYGTGTAGGPAAILTASCHVETFDEELAFDHEEHLRYATLPPIVADPEERVEAYMKRLERVCAGFGLGPPFYLGLGGEHSVTAPMLAGILQDPAAVTVVQIDAHADLREEYHGSRYNHACAMRRILDLGVKGLISVGIRSAEREEYELAREDPRITTWYDHQLRDEKSWKKVLEQLRAVEGPIHLTVDIDGLDCTLCPGTGTPQPGGLSWSRALDVARVLGSRAEGTLVGADICEVSPQAGTQLNEMVAAKLAYKIVGYRFAEEKKKAAARA
jgi:agmatinase